MCIEYWNICLERLEFKCEGLIRLEHKDKCSIARTTGGTEKCPFTDERTSFVMCTSCAANLGEQRKTHHERAWEAHLAAELGHVNLDGSDTEQALKSVAHLAVQLGHIHIKGSDTERAFHSVAHLAVQLGHVHLKGSGGTEKAFDTVAHLAVQLDQIHLKGSNAEKAHESAAHLASQLSRVHLEDSDTNKVHETVAHLSTQLGHVHLEGEGAEKGLVNVAHLAARLGHVHLRGSDTGKAREPDAHNDTIKALDDDSSEPTDALGVRASTGSSGKSLRHLASLIHSKQTFYRPHNGLRTLVGWEAIASDGRRTSKSAKSVKRRSWERERSPTREVKSVREMNRDEFNRERDERMDIGRLRHHADKLMFADALEKDASSG